ncbi:YugN-like family protein [Halobacillus shinanisalinarum]|uniref:YugN-like family protein n=1 Tax=Halobacillus shinanisalinarum TaxID=2932258 RepID=A0ABY4H253_9BACI|nr:YugN-like family protein [Halobacillus shinanisalinarum]UOQ94214.1 YugN-like family protein [Halobacillus shinanisalinarum]
MISLSSQLTDELFDLHELEQNLRPIGFNFSDNWDYEHGYFDYKLGDENGYLFLRIPFSVVEGTLDSPSNPATVKMNEPYLLAHVYQDGIDDHVREGNFRASIDQFQTPKDKDANFPEEHIQAGQEILQQAEQALLSKGSK